MDSNLKGSVLITRPEQDSMEVAREIEALNYHVICEPFLKVKYHNIVLPDFNQYSGIIFTSANAVRAIRSEVKNFNIPVFCVGSQTTKEAKELGFQNIQNADGNVEDLIDLLKMHTAEKPYLYIRGQDISKDISGCIKGVQIEEIIVYSADLIEEISDLTRQVIMRGEVGHILFFSKRTAESFIQWIQSDPQSGSIAAALKHTRALCLGDSMVQCLSVITWKDIQVASHPDRQSLINLLR